MNARMENENRYARTVPVQRCAHMESLNRDAVSIELHQAKKKM
jgi:hypothetical protein